MLIFAIALEHGIFALKMILQTAITDTPGEVKAATDMFGGKKKAVEEGEAVREEMTREALRRKEQGRKSAQEMLNDILSDRRRQLYHNGEEEEVEDATLRRKRRR